jgi:hypothetical protein
MRVKAFQNQPRIKRDMYECVSVGVQSRDPIWCPAFEWKRPNLVSSLERRPNFCYVQEIVLTSCSVGWGKNQASPPAAAARASLIGKRVRQIAISVNLLWFVEGTAASQLLMLLLLANVGHLCTRCESWRRSPSWEGWLEVGGATGRGQLHWFPEKP